MDDEEVVAEEGGGVPAWVMTFADLMTLLMCFFVLLLAFSEMDAAKFKELSGSVKKAFGVQSEIEARTIPKGTSVIAREFSPGTPQPTLLNEIRQFTIDSNKNTLEFDESDDNKKELEEAAKRIRDALAAEISEGAVAVETDEERVIIHILEKASFSSGDNRVRNDFKPTLVKISRLLEDSTGNVDVAGHTDNIPIRTSRFRSNWELSTSRAVSVAHILLENSSLIRQRFTVTGHAETKPRSPNDTAEGRGANRRVDIRIVIGEDDVSGNVLQASDADTATQINEEETTDEL
ncbi:MAG: flagellar motor protein MotB [Woeseiaceae bacterium]